MRTSVWPGALAASVMAWFGACGHEVKEDQALLGRLPMEQKQIIYAAEHNVSVARANVDEAGRGIAGARSFENAAGTEVGVAHERVEAAESAVTLARRTGDAPSVRAADHELMLAQRQLAVARAERRYAERLVALREDERDLAGSRLDDATNQLALTRAVVLQRNNLRPSEDIEALRARQADIRADIARREARTGALRSEVEGLRLAWEQRRSAYDTAARELPAWPAPPVPLPREPVPRPIPPQD